MHRDEIEAVFDKCAAGYDRQWATLAPLRDALHLLAAAALADLRADARILCVGAGTGTELLALARRHPGWHFTAVEPSRPMLDVCRQNADAAGIADRCTFHAGYLETLPPAEPFDAATALLVSQFIVDRAARIEFFRGIAERLRPGGWLISADLAADTAAAEHRHLSEVWWKVMRGADATPEGLEKLRAAYAKDVAVLPPAAVAAGGFDAPVQFLQMGRIHAWFTQRSAVAA